MVSAIGDPDSSSTDGTRPIQRASVGATKAPTQSRTGVARGGRRTVAVTTLRARPAGGGRVRNSSLTVTSHVVRASGGQETCPSHDDRSARNLHQPEAISSRSCIAGPGTRRSDRSALVPVGRGSRPPSLLRSSRCLAVIPKPRWMPRSLDSWSTRERRASNEGCGERLRGEGARRELAAELVAGPDRSSSPRGGSAPISLDRIESECSCRDETNSLESRNEPRRSVRRDIGYYDWLHFPSAAVFSWVRTLSFFGDIP
jgi:hypothetical protein